MDKKAFINFNCKNVEVTRTYLDVVKAALERAGFETEYVSSLEGVPKKALIIHATSLDAYKAYFKGYKRFMVWLQGIVAEESYMRNKSKLRMAVLNHVDRFVLKRAEFVLFVSEHMKEYYQSLVKREFENSHLMPCFNEYFDPEVIAQKDYTKKTFTYVGSLDVWQCFEQTMELYSKIEAAIPEATLKVLTFKPEEAEATVKKYGIKNYEIKRVPKEQVKEELMKTSYGFLLRGDVEVNRVATPTKISSYLSSGVIPIYSPCLTDFHKQARTRKVAVPFSLGDSADALIETVKGGVDTKALKDGVTDIFSTYYSFDYHTDILTEKFKKSAL